MAADGYLELGSDSTRVERIPCALIGGDRANRRRTTGYSGRGRGVRVAGCLILASLTMQIAKGQGLITSFTVLETGTDEGPWNVVVSVTYPNEKGFEGPRPSEP